MGLLVDGVWTDQWYDTKSTGGRFVRKDASFRNWITPDGAAGSSGKGGFKAEAGRYHLFVSYACPWAHRAMVFRKLKGLEDLISLSAVQPLMLENGWEFAETEPVAGAKYAWNIYAKADPSYTGRATVPILWDKHQNTIVSNESSEIIRMFNSAFDDLTGSKLDFYPAALRIEIDEVNERIYHTLNNGVYKSGFATTQEAYEEAVTALFDTLDFLEDRLSTRRYLAGEQLTEADWRLFTTLVRFDAVYVGHFKCNIRRIADYPNLSNYLLELYQVPGVAETVDMPTIKQHYYGSHESVNPTRIVPVGPDLDFLAPHNRDRLKAAA
ncbi:glutathione S-transferase family protein [Roseibium porphyridii]|uniref:Glutathione S-transferase family protein n=1 Tax=Roseibium porphyridii TaxID=2866279 RepID=A0ABY8F787_9HYPH|nr:MULTISPECIES: glutathione S-transferase family protein [Stappiaceae]QFT30731.1 Glutathionyl-hydroquinone reductase YqjG [Labrenzia sp. THAF82]WFE91360.1 glutathione S-transferase family protein [Roseibium sp. KMA01]